MRMPSTLLKEFIVSLGCKAGSTVEAYQRELRHFLDWISRRAGNSGPFNPQQQLTKTALQTYMAYLQSENHSISHCARVKSAVGGFARWLTGFQISPKRENRLRPHATKSFRKKPPLDVL